MSFKRLRISAAVAVALFAATTAHAATIVYAVGGVGPTSYPSSLPVPPDAPNGQNGYPGDTVEFQSYTDVLNLVPGTSTLKVNTLLWNIDYTYGGTSEADWTNPSFSIDATRSIQLDTVSGSLSQSGSLVTTWFTDTLSFAPGASSTFFVDGFKVVVTPLPVPASDAGDLGPQSPQDVMAQFDVSAVPEPAIWTTMLLGFFGVGFMLRRTRNASAFASA